MDILIICIEDVQWRWYSLRKPDDNRLLSKYIIQDNKHVLNGDNKVDNITSWYL